MLRLIIWKMCRYIIKLSNGISLCVCLFCPDQWSYFSLWNESAVGKGLCGIHTCPLIIDVWCMDEREIIKHVTVQTGLLHVKSTIHLNSSLEIPESNRLRILALTVKYEYCSGGRDCVLSA